MVWKEHYPNLVKIMENDGARRSMVEVELQRDSTSLIEDSILAVPGQRTGEAGTPGESSAK